MLMLAGAVAGAGLSALSIGDANEANSKQFLATVDNIKASFSKQIGQLNEQAASQQEDYGVKLSGLRYQGLKLDATTTNKIAESGISGNTAERLYNQTSVVQTMAHNALAKEANDNAISFGVEMENARDRANQTIVDAGNKAASQYQDPVMGMLNGALAGASLASSFSALGTASAGATTVANTGSNPALLAFRGGV